MPIITIDPFTNTKQEKTFWCWAAVTANCYNALNPSTVPPMSQCDVVTKVGQNCNTNAPYLLAWALSDVGIADENPTWPRVDVVELEFEGFSEPFDPPEGVKAEPVCAQIRFPGGALHFVAITEINTDNQHVWVADPNVGGASVEFTWDDFIKNYNYVGGAAKNLQRVVNNAGA